MTHLQALSQGLHTTFALIMYTRNEGLNSKVACINETQ